MSRRPQNAGPDRALQNQQTLKTLVKVESNKTCADCKRNKHPRWASWNLGIFVCIRCSGIHRGMGTHISRVKSVDLDSWTDEQLASMLKWGNARANKYWEAKLAPGHVPADNKIENFIRTKYDTKRWVMDGGIPDPATLDAEGDDEVPLNVVQEKARIERSASLRAAPSPAKASSPPSLRKPLPPVDLFGDDASLPPISDTTRSVPPHPASEAEVAAVVPTVRQHKASDSLLGLDFLSSTPAGLPTRPSSAAASMSSFAGPSRPDLKQSILSLYASAPRPPPSQQNGASNAIASHQKQPSTSSGIDEAFGGLTFGSNSSQAAQRTAAVSKPSPFQNLTGGPSGSANVSTHTGGPRETNLSGGNFFIPSHLAKSTTARTKQNMPTAPSITRGMSSSSGFGDFTSMTSPVSAAPPRTNSSNGLGDLFDFSSPSNPGPAPPRGPGNPISSTNASPFNLSAAAHQSAQKPPSQTNSSSINSTGAMQLGPDAWGSNNVWATSTAPAPASASTVAAQKSTPTVSATNADWGWSNSGSSRTTTGVVSNPQGPKVSADEDFGGWESSAISPTVETKQPPPSQKQATGFSGNEDLFSNVWE